MSPALRRARLATLRARRDLALRAQAFGAAQAAAGEAAALADRIEGLLAAQAGAAAGPTTPGALAAALWLGTALQAERGRSATRLQEAEAAAAAERARVAAAAAALRRHADRSTALRQAEQAAAADRAEAALADRPR